MGKRHKKHLYKKVKATKFINPNLKEENVTVEKEPVTTSVIVQTENEKVELTRHPVKQELTKVALTFSFLLILLIGVVMLSQRTILLDTFSTKLATLFHIN